MTKNQIKYANQFKNNFKIYNSDNKDNDNINIDELDSIATTNSTVNTTQHAMTVPVPMPMPGPMTGLRNEQYPLLLQERQIMTLYDYYLHHSRNGNRSYSINRNDNCNSNINSYSTTVRTTSN